VNKPTETEEQDQFKNSSERKAASVYKTPETKVQHQFNNKPKQRNKTVKMPPPLVKCIFCHSIMIIPDMPPINYIDHLEKHHQIIFEMDFVINRTLLEQHPNLIKETVSSEGDDENEHIDASDFLKQSNGSIESEFVIDPETSLLSIKEEHFDIESMDEEPVFGDDKDVEMDDLLLQDIEISKDTENIEDIVGAVEETISNDYLNHFPNNIETTLHVTLDEIDTKENIVLMDESMDVSGFGQHFLNEQPSSEPKLPWYHGCLYSCQLCTKQFIQKESFKQHIESTHSLEYEKYEKTENGEKSYIKNTHECEQCGKGVNWNKSAIEKHLSSQHKSTLEEYYEEFKNDLELPVFEITDPNLLSRFGVESTDKKDDDGMSSTGSDFSWANKCVYKCNICEINFNSRYDFERHMPSVHKMSVGDYTKDHGKGIIHQEKHFCQIEDCNSKMFWDKTSIAIHIRKHDNMSLQDYAANYMDNYKESSDDSLNKSLPSPDMSWANRSVYNCVICETKIISRKAFESHIKGKHKLLPSEYTAEHGRTVEHEEKHDCQIDGCSSTFLWDSVAINSHLRLKHEFMSVETYGTKYMSNYIEKSKNASSSYATDIFDRCIYKCALCEVELFSKSRLSYHLKSVHSISMNDYNKEYGRNMSHEEKHSCQVESCTAYMWWDRSHISAHLRNSHIGLLLEEYEAKYMGNYAEKPQSEESVSLSSSMLTYNYSWANRCTFKCALCNTTFDSRRKFEGHVKGKHEMMMGDYATQHGRTIEHEEKHTCQVEECSSTFLWDSVAIVGHLKLKHDSLPLHQYEKKYMSTYNKPPNIVKIKKEKGLNLETYAWTNKCVFKCALCGDEIGSRYKFTSHIKSQHSITVKDYLNEHGKSIIHEENHSCQIESCHAFILWDKQFIYDHLYDKHEKMPLEDYEKTYMGNYVEKVKIKTEKVSSFFSPDFSWASKCRFKCAICETTFDSRSKFESHIKSKHQMLVGDYTIKYGKCIEYEEKHSCQVEECGSTFQWDISRINHHLKLKHENLSLEDYGNKYMSSYTDVKIKKEKGLSSFPSQDFSWANKCIFKCVLCDTTMDSRRKFEGHVKGKHEMMMGDYATQHGRTIEHEEKHTCQVEECSSTFLWDSVALLGHLKLKHDSLPLQEYEKKYMATYKDKSEKSKTTIPSGYNVSWANRCIFKCIICDTTKKSRKKFEKHIKLMHQKNLSEYQKEHGKTMAVDKKHLCQIEHCNSTFTWDSTSFVHHFRLKHENMTLQEYEQTFMVNYKEKADQGAVDANEESSEINQCTYLCQICEHKFTSENGFKNHLKKDHTVGLDSYKKDFGWEIDNKVLHTCQLCQENTELLWNSNELFLHAKEVHQMPAEQYLQKHIKSWTTSDTDYISEEEKWMFKCRFGCKECKLSFNKKEHLQKHLVDVHKSQETLDDQKLNFIRKEFHKCLICKTKTEILWDKMNIENHLRSNHVIGMSTYHKYLAAQPQKQQDDDWMNKCLFKCIVEGCGSVFNTSILLGKHFMDVHKDGKIYDMKQSPVLKMVRHVCQICCEDLMWESAYLSPHFEKHNVEPEEYKEKYMPSYQFNEIFLVPVQQKTEEESEEILSWTAGTLYLCNICNQEVAGLYQFEKHLKTLHQTDYKQYERSHTDFVKFPGFHICKVCQKNVKHDRKPLKNHMKEHNISITEYFNKYKPRMPKLYKHMKNKLNKN